MLTDLDPSISKEKIYPDVIQAIKSTPDLTFVAGKKPYNALVHALVAVYKHSEGKIADFKDKAIEKVITSAALNYLSPGQALDKVLDSVPIIFAKLPLLSRSSPEKKSSFTFSFDKGKSTPPSATSPPPPPPPPPPPHPQPVPEKTDSLTDSDLASLAKVLKMLGVAVPSLDKSPEYVKETVLVNGRNFIIIDPSPKGHLCGRRAAAAILYGFPDNASRWNKDYKRLTATVADTLALHLSKAHSRFWKPYMTCPSYGYFKGSPTNFREVCLQMRRRNSPTLPSKIIDFDELDFSILSLISDTSFYSLHLDESVDPKQVHYKIGEGSTYGCLYQLPGHFAFLAERKEDKIITSWPSTDTDALAASSKAAVLHNEALKKAESPAFKFSLDDTTLKLSAYRRVDPTPPLLSFLHTLMNTSHTPATVSPVIDPSPSLSRDKQRKKSARRKRPPPGFELSSPEQKPLTSHTHTKFALTLYRVRASRPKNVILGLANIGLDTKEIVNVTIEHDQRGRSAKLYFDTRAALLRFSDQARGTIPSALTVG